MCRSTTQAQLGIGTVHPYLRNNEVVCICLFLSVYVHEVPPFEYRFSQTWIKSGRRALLTVYLCTGWSIFLEYCALERYEAMAAVSLADALDEFNFAATCKWQATGDTKNGVSENLKGIVLVHFFSPQWHVCYDWLKLELKVPLCFPSLTSTYFF